MPTTSVTVSSKGVSDPIQLSLRRWNHCIGLLATVAPLSQLTYSVELTGDKLQGDDYNPASGNWNNHDTMAAQTVSKNGELDFPVTGVRLNVSSWTAGSVTLSVVQAET